MKHASLLAVAGSILLFACSDAGRAGDVDPLGARLSGERASSAACEPPRADALGLGSDTGLVWNGNGYGVVRYTWSNAEGPKILFERRDAAGQRMGEPVPVLAEEPIATRLVRTDTGYGLAVATPRGASTPRRVIKLIRLDDAGQRIGDDVVVTNWGVLDNMDLAFAGGDYRVVWTEGGIGVYTVEFARYDSRGQRIAEDVVSGSAKIAESPRIAWSGSQHGLVWSDSRTDSRFEIYFAATDVNGDRIGDEKRLTTQGGTKPVIVWAGGNFGVFYDERTDTGRHRVRFLKVGEDGARLSDPVTVSDADDYSNISVVWTGTRYGVALKGPDSLGGLRILTLDAAGKQAAPPIPIQIDSYYPSLAWTGEGYRATWTYQPRGQDPYVAQISPLLCP